jgi:hypothetical protein
MFEKYGSRFLMSKWDLVKYYDVDLVNTIVVRWKLGLKVFTLYSDNTFVI